MADPLEAILASMAKATGNAPINTPTAEPPTHAATDSETIISGKKRSAPDTTGTCSDGNGIWNPNVMQSLSDHDAKLLAHKAGKIITSNPAMEILRQQNVRLLCQKIRRASEEMGIMKLPNSTYETWQFTSKLTVAEQNDPLIPHAASDYSGLYEELRKAGATHSGATKKCKELTKEADRLLLKFNQQQFSVGKRHVKTSVGESMMQLTYGNSTVKLSKAHYEKLQALYARHQQVSLSKPQEKRKFENALFCLLLRYDSLDGGGFQAALNEECFDVLLKHFDCKMECFASPLNCRYGRFCSAFLDTDFVFGSVGSFFDFTPRSGCFEANPPFIPKLIKRMAEHMTALLDSTDDALGFIIIIPAWKETEGWQQLNRSRYNQTTVHIPQKEHGYCEGKQQIRTTRWRIASFDTSVFFWQNTKAANKWKITQQALEDLKVAFQSKQAVERERLGLRQSGKRVKAAK